MMSAGHDMLLSRWLDVCCKLRLHGDCAEPGGEILRRYSEPHRRYHTCDHLADCLRMLDLHAAETHDPLAVEMALWFHDAVYVVGAGDNEDRSADLAQKTLRELGAFHGFVGSVRAAIIATKHRVDPPPGDERLVCDIDLSILASPPDRYDIYAAAILAESGLSMDAFRPLRIAFLEAMVARPHVFHTTTFRRELEAQARQNMEREIESLHKRLIKATRSV